MLSTSPRLFYLIFLVSKPPARVSPVKEAGVASSSNSNNPKVFALGRKVKAGQIKRKGYTLPSVEQNSFDASEIRTAAQWLGARGGKKTDPTKARAGTRANVRRYWRKVKAGKIQRNGYAPPPVRKSRKSN